MKKAIVFSVMLMSSAAWSQAPAAGAPAASDAPDANQILCQSVSETGSRLHHSRVCKTRAEWAQERREQRQEVEHSQTRAERPVMDPT